MWRVWILVEKLYLVYVITIMKRHFPASKKAKAGESGERAVATVSTQAGGMYETRDVNPPIMPVPNHIANQMSDYATYTLKYAELFPDVSLSGSVKWSKQFRPNSIFDPNYTDGGHQPLGRDLIAGVYQHYRVLKAEFKCSFSPSGRRAADNVYVHSYILGDLVGTGATVTPTDVELLGECKRGRCWLVASENTVSSWERTIYPGLLDETIDTNGVTDQAQQSMWTPVGANPAEEQYYTIMLNTNGANEVCYVSVLVQITYTVQFRSPYVDVFRD